MRGGLRTGLVVLLGCAAAHSAHAEGDPAKAKPAPAAAPAPAPPAAAAAVAVESGVRPLTLDLAALRKLLADAPALAALAADFVPFETADVDAALKRGKRGRESITVWKFQPAAFSWTPTPGRELWIVTGRSAKRSLIAVFERRADGRNEHAASTILDEPETSIAVGHSAQIPAELLWTTCYGCAGEGGAIRLRADGRVEFVYR
jgi:hypothetical protein